MNDGYLCAEKIFFTTVLTNRQSYYSKTTPKVPKDFLEGHLDKNQTLHDP